VYVVLFVSVSVRVLIRKEINIIVNTFPKNSFNVNISNYSLDNKKDNTKCEITPQLI